MPKYRRRSSTVEAEQFDSTKPVAEWPVGMKPWPDSNGLQPRDMSWGYVGSDCVLIHIRHGDWIVADGGGRQSVYSVNQFAELFEAVPPTGEPMIFPAAAVDDTPYTGQPREMDFIDVQLKLTPEQQQELLKQLRRAYAEDPRGPQISEFKQTIACGIKRDLRKREPATENEPVPILDPYEQDG